MKDKLAGKKAIVVGASGGMGSAISLALAGEGISSALLGRSEEALSELADNCRARGASALPITLPDSHCQILTSLLEVLLSKLALSLEPTWAERCNLQLLVE